MDHVTCMTQIMLTVREACWPHCTACRPMPNEDTAGHSHLQAERHFSSEASCTQSFRIMRASCGTSCCSIIGCCMPECATASRLVSCAQEGHAG